jgi:hypothetical protein
MAAAGSVGVAAPIVFAALFAAGLGRLYRSGRLDLVATCAATLLLPLAVLYLTLGWKGNWGSGWLRYTVHLLVPYLCVAALGLRAVLSGRPRWQQAAAGICVLIGFFPGQLSYLADAARARDGVERDLAASVGRIPDLAGVVVPAIDYSYGDESARALAIYDRYRTDALPTFHVDVGVSRRVVAVPARYGLGSVPVVGPVEVLEPGRYALLSRGNRMNCGRVARMLAPRQVDEVLVDRLHVCAIGAR